MRKRVPEREETGRRQTATRGQGFCHSAIPCNWLWLLLLLIAATQMTLEAGLKPPIMLEREENNTQVPFEPWRERSTQAVTYVHEQPWLTNEFKLKHTTFKDVPGYRQNLTMIQQASFYGHNMTSPLEFQAGRHWTGNSTYRPVDGVTFYYPWGHRLSTTVTTGRFSYIYEHSSADRPSFFEGQIHYQFNDQTYLRVQGDQEIDHQNSTVQVGYNIDTLKIIGESRSSAGTDTYRLSLVYQNGSRFDFNADYLVYLCASDTSILRSYVAYDLGKWYVETGVGKKFLFGDGSKSPRENAFYEGTVQWGNPARHIDNLTLGYLLETSGLLAARTFSGTGERVISPKTRLSLSVADTRFDDGRRSIQNLEGRFHRKVEWGYFEIRCGLISGWQADALDKDVGIRAGYEF